MYKIASSLGLTALLALSGAASLAAAEAPHAYIIAPVEGATVSSPVKVVFGLSGMGVAPAGVDKQGTGHHHLLIDVAELPDLKMPVPADANHKHFVGGQTETTIDLAPGVHTLALDERPGELAGG